MKALKKVYDIFSLIEKYAIFAVFFFATVMVVINVLGRKIFGFSFNWLEELNRYILVVTTFVGASIGITLSNHPRMDSVLSLIKGRARLIVECISTLILTVFVAIMAYWAFKQLGVMIKLNASTATLKVPVYIFYMFIPIGFLGMTARCIAKLIMEVRDAVVYKKPAAEESAIEGSENA